MSVVTPDRGLRGPQGPIKYPESDGKPMADNEAQLFLMLLMIAHLRHKLGPLGHHAGGNMFWYPVEGQPKINQAPDVFVAFNRPQLPLRRSWKQWEEDNRPLAFAVEIVSDSNTRADLERKRQWYERYGVDEFVVLDPERGRIVVHRRLGDKLAAVVGERVARSVGLEFRAIPDDIEVTDLEGGRVLDYSELQDRLGVERAHALAASMRAEQESLRAEQESLRAEQESLRAEQESLRAEQAIALAEQAVQRADAEAARVRQLERLLRQAGIDPNAAPD